MQTKNDVIKAIEELNKSKVICYITNDNPVFSGEIAADVYPIFFDVLEEIGNTDRIDLFIFSQGGDTLVPWKLVNLIRGYTKEFNVLIPFHANSAATLIALGANKVYMTKLADIGPIDPTLTGPFNPKNDNGEVLGLSVEDVIGYYELAKNIMNLKSESSILKTFEMLSNDVNPIALGSIYRSYNQIRILARKLLELHLDAEKDTVLINRVIENLTEKLYNHRHLIVRDEARDIFNEDIIVYPEEELEKLMLNLYRIFRDDMNLGNMKGLNVEFIGQESEKQIEGTHALIESLNTKYRYKTKKIFRKIENEEGDIRIEATDENIGWVK